MHLMGSFSTLKSLKKKVINKDTELNFEAQLNFKL